MEAVENGVGLLYHAFVEVAEKFPDRTAISTTYGESYTYREFLKKVNRISASLVNRGVGSEDTIVVGGLRNSASYAALIFAVARVGACYVPILQDLDESQVNSALSLVSPVLLVTEKKGYFDSPHEVLLSELSSEEEELQVNSSPLKDSRFRVLWSSGSTGSPKAIACKQESLLFERKRWIKHLGINADDVLYCRHTLDVAHATDLHLFTGLLAGAEVVLAESDASSDEHLQSIAALNITVMSALPQHYAQLVESAEDKHKGRVWFPSLRLALCGGTYTGDSVIENSKRILGLRLRELYGSTEYGLAAIDLRTGPANGYMQFLPGISARIVPLSQNNPNVGELVLAAPWTSEGYLNSPEANARTYRRNEYWTGDVVHCNSAGEIRVLGRLSETLLGRQGLVLTSQLDEDLIAHCSISDAVSVCADTDDRSDLVRVLIKPNANGGSTALSSVKARLQSFHGLNGEVRVVEKIPRTTVGKPDKSAISREWKRSLSSPLVLIPGLAMTASCFSPLIAEMSKTNEVIVFEMPGHGQAASVAVDPGSVGPTLDTVAEGLHRILEQKKLKDVTLVGWSLGAGVAYTYLESHDSHRVARLVSVEMTPKLLTQNQWKHAAFGGLEIENALALIKKIRTDYHLFVDELFQSLFASNSTPSSNLVNDLIAESMKCQPEDIAALWADAIKRDWRTSLAKICLPTLVLHGRGSRVFPTDVGNWLADVIPTVKYIQFENSGHAPFLEEPAKFTNELRNFISEF